MRVRILYFGILKDVMGREREELELAEGSSVETVLTRMKAHAGSPEGVWESIAVAVNQEYVRSTALLQNGDEVALLPPVSGGL
jgi:molybdopterin converting factor subunit 1